ncbi:thioredoxin domain-containing protein [Parasphingorhabdus cellanae]|uniref:Thioredoxin domain-containing protein n=1 Tax=Parasphingorhabdus cellanae TaxID=2806553 RepID=A0ABX7T830_9SPHN|nr:thioredoxin domain-containing protein [Parasphingorhabdus cellanae]QTD57063.1 thioredoxin domain-containing protein [Parasphingorhabdus cellanae]
MKFGSAYLASAALGAATMVAAPAVAQSQTEQTDWTQRITMSDQGGHIMGNPLAKHRLTEYMSYTCNHCANFEAESHDPLKSGFVNKGHVSFEVRNLVLNPIDLTAAMLARCGGRTKFFGNHRALLIAQESWVKTFQSSSPKVMKSLSEGTVPERLKKIAKAADFYGLMKKRGYSNGQVDACLSDKSAQDAILGMTKYATQTLKLSSTPSFTLNDKPVDKVHSWARLRPTLVALAE